jgi:hypothetical protein
MKGRPAYSVKISATKWVVHEPITFNEMSNKLRCERVPIPSLSKQAYNPGMNLNFDSDVPNINSDQVHSYKH